MAKKLKRYWGGFVADKLAVDFEADGSEHPAVYYRKREAEEIYPDVRAVSIEEIEQ